MFSAYEFTYAGESSELYGVHLYDFGGQGQRPVSFGNKAEISETRIASRVQPIHYGVNYHASPLEFTLVFGSLERALDRYQMADIAMWLTGRQNYEWLTIGQSDLEGMRFRCIVTQLTPIHHDWLPYAFEATVRCDCPYAYGYPFERQYIVGAGEQALLFQNEGSCREYLKPVLTFVPANGTKSLAIVNEDDGGRTFEISELPTGVSFSVDCGTGIIEPANTAANGGVNLYRGFNMTLPRFVHGDNRLRVTGKGTLTISGAFLYNVAA